MNCNEEAVDLMHTYLDGDLMKEEEDTLRKHLEHCEACQTHFQELNRTVTLLQTKDTMKAPKDFTRNVLRELPTEKRYVKYTRWMKSHPIFTVAAVFVLFFIGSLFTAWSEQNKLVVSKEENIIIEGDTVIVPEGETVAGDLVVKNGKLMIDGIVDGNVTLINSMLVDDTDETGLLASADSVNGELKKVDQMIDWIWYNVKQVFQAVFSLHMIQLLS